MNRFLVPGLCVGLSLVPGFCLSATDQSPPPTNAHVSAHVQGLGARREGWPLLYRVDFGHEGEDLDPGAIAYDGSRPNRYVTWRRGMVRLVTRPSVLDPLTRDFMEGEEAILILAADTASTPVHCILTFGDAARGRGPVRVAVGDGSPVSEAATEPGEFLDVELEAMPSQGKVEIRLTCEPCASFALCAVSVYAPVSKQLFELEGVSESVFIDSTHAPLTANAVQAKQALRSYIEYLSAHQPVEGCYAYSGNWYESAYALRALLVAATLLHTERYRESVFECLDRFVDEQGTDGTWSAQYFGRRNCALARTTKEESESRNLADVGTMALTLCMAVPEARGERRKSYLRAAARFADAIVLPNQLPSGAFPNLEFKNRLHRHPYSVATGVQAANLAALYAVTGDRRYRDAALRAALFLCRNIVDDGRIVFYPFDSDAAVLLDPDGLGDIYYILEGLTWVARYADAASRREIRRALDRYFESPWGVQSWPAPSEWLAADNMWEGSKRAGFLFLVSQYVAQGESPAGLRDWMQANLSALCDAQIGMSIGILSDPAGPEGRHALFATGMAGMSMASVLQPSVFFPVKKHAGR